jgi:hypothetical protein
LKLGLLQEKFLHTLIESTVTVPDLVSTEDGYRLPKFISFFAGDSAVVTYPFKQPEGFDSHFMSSSPTSCFLFFRETSARMSHLIRKGTFCRHPSTASKGGARKNLEITVAV